MKRNRDNYEEKELETVNKRIREIDTAVIGRKRGIAVEEYQSNKKQRVETVITHEMKAHEYRSCIITLYKMNKRIMAKNNLLLHEAEYYKNKYHDLEKRCLSHGITNRQISLQRENYPILQEVV
tara:strand:- start:654 stop:1025 length:372 start_codon:yes stop_codon:yes gene_type:complete